MRLFLVAGCLVVLLTGCLGSTDYDAVHAAATEKAMPSLDAAVDGAPLPTSFNVAMVGYHNGIDQAFDPGAVPAGGRFTELAVTDDRVYLARSSQGAGAGTEGTFGGFSIIDIRDPADPFLVSQYHALGSSDIEVDAAERLVFFATQRNTVEELVGGLTVGPDPTDLAPRGITVVDVANKRAPAFESFTPLPYNGVHTIEYVQHPNGQDYVIACTYDLYGNTIPSSTGGAGNAVFPFGVNPVTQQVIVYSIQRPSDGPAFLEPVSRFQLTDSPGPDEAFFPHDTFVAPHPVTGQTLLYVAYWDKGVRILDFDDPAAPTEIGSFDGFTPSSFDSIHLAAPFDDLLDGVHVTVAEPEIPSGDETGQITFLDTTDPTRPVKLGHWTQPHPDLVVSSFDHSPHNFDLLDGLVALAHNQLGLWIIDVSDAHNMAEPKTVGLHISGLGGNDTVSAYWGAFWLDRPDGAYVLAADQATGLHILEYTGPRR